MNNGEHEELRLLRREVIRLKQLIGVQEWYTVTEAALLVGCEPTTMRRWCLRGQVTAIKSLTKHFGKHTWRISHAEVLRVQREGPRPLERKSIGVKDDYTLSEAASVLGCEPATLRQRCLDGQVTAIQSRTKLFGTYSWRISHEELIRLQGQAPHSQREGEHP